MGKGTRELGVQELSQEYLPGNLGPEGYFGYWRGGQRNQTWFSLARVAAGNLHCVKGRSWRRLYSVKYRRHPRRTCHLGVRPLFRDRYFVLGSTKTKYLHVLVVLLQSPESHSRSSTNSTSHRCPFFGVDLQPSPL